MITQTVSLTGLLTEIISSALMVFTIIGGIAFLGFLIYHGIRLVLGKEECSF